LLAYGNSPSLVSLLDSSERDSVMRRVTEPMFLSDQRRSNTTVTLINRQQNKRISGDGAFVNYVDKSKTLLLHARVLPESLKITETKIIQ